MQRIERCFSIICAFGHHTAIHDANPGSIPKSCPTIHPSQKTEQWKQRSTIEAISHWICQPRFQKPGVHVLRSKQFRKTQTGNNSEQWCLPKYCMLASFHLRGNCRFTPSVYSNGMGVVQRFNWRWHRYQFSVWLSNWPMNNFESDILILSSAKLDSMPPTVTFFSQQTRQSVCHINRICTSLRVFLSVWLPNQALFY